MKSNIDVLRFLKKVCISERYELPLLKASDKQGYVETYSNKADGLHHHLRKEYPEVLTEKFFESSKERIRRLKLGTVDLVADITEENFYGKYSGLYTHGWTGEKGVKAKFRFLVVAVKFRNMLIPFYVAILPVGCFKADYLGEGVDWFQTLGIKARKIILDRGFYSGDIIDTLKLKKMKYLIFVPKKKLYKCMLESVEDECTIEYEIKYAKDKSTYYAKTNLALLKDVKSYDWIFATDIFLTAEKYVRLYKQRWNIETMFRVHDEARIKSKSTKATTRLFYFIISMLLVQLWNIHHKTKTTFKLFITQLYEQEFFKKLGIKYAFSPL